MICARSISTQAGSDQDRLQAKHWHVAHLQSRHTLVQTEHLILDQFPWWQCCGSRGEVFGNVAKSRRPVGARLALERQGLSCFVS